MTDTANDLTWHDLVDAAVHKLEIADLRYERLTEQLDRLADDRPPDVPLEVQEPFEGLLTAVVAAKQQLTDAILNAQQLPTSGQDRGRLIAQALNTHHSDELADAIRTWMEHPVVEDMTDIRNLATHAAYEKRLQDGDWQVQQPRAGIDAHQPRDLHSYATVVHDHAQTLRRIAEQLADELADSTEADPGTSDVDVIDEDGKRMVRWTIPGSDGGQLVVRHDAPDMLKHLYSPKGQNEDVPLFAGRYVWAGENTDRPFEGDVRFMWRPSPRVVARGRRAVSTDELAAMFEPSGAAWVTAPTIDLVDEHRTVPEPPTGPTEPPQTGDDVSVLVAERLGNQTFGEPNCLEKVTFLIPNGWRSTNGTVICNPADRRHRWRGRLEAAGGRWQIVIDALPQTTNPRYWKSRRSEGGYAFTHVGQITADDHTPFETDALDDTLDALRVAFSLALGRSTAPLLPVGWADQEPRWASWTTPPVDRLGSAGTWLDVSTAAEQVSEVVGRILDRWSDPVVRDVLRYATSYYVTANVDVDAELIVAMAVSGLQLLAHHRFMTVRNAYSNTRWRKKMSTETQLRLLLDDCQIPTSVPGHFSHLKSVQQQLNLSRGSPQDALNCIMKLRNKVVHPTRDERRNWSLYQWAEAGFVALYFLEHALLNTIGYSGATKPRIRSNNDPTVSPVPWT